MIDLFDSTGNRFSLENEAWKQVLRVAKEHGWKQKRTISPVPGWSGSYHLQHGQIITPSDAGNISAALRKSEENLELADFIGRNKIYIF